MDPELTINAIREENDRLRKRVHELAGDKDRVLAENGKLRDLAHDMFMTFCTFREAPMTDSEELRHSVRYWKKLTELGIEVDDG